MFDGENDPPIFGCDDAWGLGWMRYGLGDWRLASCWDGRLCAVGADGAVQAMIEAGGPARLRWSANGRLTVAVTQQGEIWRVDADGTVAWQARIPVQQAPPVHEPLSDEPPQLNRPRA